MPKKVQKSQKKATPVAVKKPSTVKKTAKILPVAKPEEKVDLAPLKPEIPESSVIWEEISFLPIDVFGITKHVSNYFQRVPMDNKQLHLKMYPSAALPALELTLNNPQLTKNKKYTVELAEQYVVVARA